MDKKSNRAATALGIAVLGSLVTGVACLLVTTFAFFNYDWVGAGICLGAAALSFGLIANAISRE
jgi:hypothetical protein